MGHETDQHGRIRKQKEPVNFCVRLGTQTLGKTGKEEKKKKKGTIDSNPSSYDLFIFE